MSGKVLTYKPTSWQGLTPFYGKIDIIFLDFIIQLRLSSISIHSFVIGYDKFMQDLITFHIWGTICMNQVLNVSKHLERDKEMPLDHFTTSGILIDNVGSSQGISAMSISDMTQIPRATIIRKCKYLIKEDLIKVNEKKQYVLASLNFKKTLPYQTEAFRFKAKFIRKILNLLVIS